MSNFIDLSSQRFGRLKVIEKVGVSSSKNSLWLCKCDCGKTTIVSSNDLKSGNTISCGCYKTDIMKSRQTTHGYSNTRLYRIWKSIKSRCYNEKSISYKNYGAKGIHMCDEWKNKFINFYAWAISTGYNDTLSIDRIDVYGNYEPTNCRWATPKEQSNNKTNNRVIVLNGETKTLSQWADITGVPRTTITNRLNRGMSVEEALKNKKHKTMLDDFKEKYPNAPISEDGTPKTCPYNLGYDKVVGCPEDAKDFHIYCVTCWNRPYEERDDNA